MQESSLAETWIYYDEFINTIHSEAMLNNNSPGPGIDLYEELPGPIDFIQWEKLFPPSPPFPPLEGGCGDLASVQLSCPNSSQHKVNILDRGLTSIATIFIFLINNSSDHSLSNLQPILI